jgi:hypothetical protein
LRQKLPAPLCFIELSDPPRHVGQASQRAQETAVGLISPTHVATAAPPTGAQRIQPAVVADAVVGVRLHVVATKVSELRPAVEITRPTGHHVGHLFPSHVRRRRQSVGQGLACFGRFNRENGCGWSRGGKVHGPLIGHLLDRRTGECLEPRPFGAYAAAVLVAAIEVPTWLDTDSLQTVFIVIVLAFVALSLLSAWLMKTIVTKVIAVALCLALAGFLFVQRNSLADCADKVRGVTPGQGEVRCDVAGLSVKIPTDQLPKQVRDQLEQNR